MADSGTFSEGFRTNVLPQAIATGNIQSGTIDGKLNGVMPTQTPTGWRLVSQSTLGAMFSQRLAHEQAGDAAGELDHLDAALHLGPRLGERLAVLARDQGRQLLEACLRSARGNGTGRGPARPPASRSRPAGRRRAAHRPVDLLGRAIGHFRLHAAGRRIEDLAAAIARRGLELPPIRRGTVAIEGAVVIADPFARYGCRFVTVGWVIRPLWRPFVPVCNGRSNACGGGWSTVSTGA